MLSLACDEQRSKLDEWEYVTLRGDREAALTLSKAVIPYLQRTAMVAFLVPYIALLHAQQPGSETNAAMLIGFFDIEVQRTKRLVPPFVTDTRDRVMMLVQTARGTVSAQQSAAGGARLTEEQAIELMFGDALPLAHRSTH